MTSHTDLTQWPAVTRYLQELDAALVDVPGGERLMILADVTDHISSALSEHPDAVSSADVDRVLSELGSPQAIVDEGVGTQPAPAVDAPRRTRFAATKGYAAMTVLILALGGIVVPFLGWIVGVVLLWISRAWPVRAKVVGTLVLPGGALFIALLVFSPVLMSEQSTECTSSAAGGPQDCTTEYSGAPLWLGPTILVVLIALQVFSAIYVYRKFRASED